jgi:predicted secreted protein
VGGDMVKRICLMIFISFVFLFPLFAGDIATFENLGFSEDSRYFLFGQYGIISEESIAYGELYLVDVHKNAFAPNGVKKTSHKDIIQPGQNGQGSFYNIFRENAKLAEKYNIDHLQIGRLVYLLVDGEKPKSHIEFRDFNTGNKYAVDLYQTSYKDGGTIKASFHIIIEVIFNSGMKKSYTVGLPNYRREEILAYRIRQIILSPNEESVIFVVEKESPREDGKSVRYMVETVKISE